MTVPIVDKAKLEEAHTQLSIALEAPKVSAEELKNCIEAYSFLMDYPGAARQKLRLAISTLKRLDRAAERAAGAQGGAAGAEEASSGASTSPHAKATYDPAQFELLSTQYENLKWRLISMPGGATKKPESFYRLYAFFKQATTGDNTTTRPVWAERGGIDFDGRASWDAWTNVKGVKTEDARLAFVKEFWEFSPRDLFNDTRASL